ncbi:DUF4402 domain-containing protein [Sneathiella marina]|uniref:DUF4402 domain-containing protein n=1 Tax=Sneathiella marina TaxID=2950108 RepID=A0ABY4W391_9PROT|nr:DUF4402 domain-containing protein [Sneathiella marina]USG59764.1 DUF4402 domain-containing protein [Sneathiella marina]
MKRYLKACGLAAIGLGVVSAALAEEATDNPVAINLVKLLTVQQTTAMDLGELIVGNNPDNYIYLEVGDELPGGFTLHGATSYGTPQPGVFKITGIPKSRVTITMKEGTNPRNEAKVELTIAGVYGSFSNGNTLNKDGVLNIKSGILLQYPSGATGNFTGGTYTVTIEYE